MLPELVVEKAFEVSRVGESRFWELKTVGGNLVIMKSEFLVSSILRIVCMPPRKV